MDRHGKHGPISRSSSLSNSQCASQLPKHSAATSSNVSSKAPASQRQRSFTVHSLDTSKSTPAPQINTERDFLIRDMRTKSRKRHSKGPSPRRVHADETILKLKEDLHDLLSTSLGSRRHNVRSPDRWGSNIATPSHSRHYSQDCRSEANILEKIPDSKPYSRAGGHLPKPQAKGSPFGNSRFVLGHRRSGSTEPGCFRLNSVLGTRDPIQCDFRKTPEAIRKLDRRGPKLEEPAFTRRGDKIRIRQMTLVFSRWDWEIVVSTPATRFPENSSPANVEIITSFDILDCIYLHLSEPILSDSAEWNSASWTEQDIARQSLAGRGGNILKRVDWLGGRTMFAGLEYAGGATCNQGAGADAGRWMVTFG